MRSFSLRALIALGLIASSTFIHAQQLFAEDLEAAADPTEETKEDAAPAEGESVEAEAEEPEETLFGNWGGVKDYLEESGISVEASIIGDSMKVTRGGLERDFNETVAYMFGTTVDTEKAGLWSNGTFLVSLLGITGGPLWAKVGDIQVSDSIDSYGKDTFTLYEAWYEHSFMDGDLTVLFGMHEYNSEFYLLDYATALINSSFFFGPELSYNYVSTWPITGLGLRVRVQPTDNTYGMFAVYDGTPGDPDHLNGTHIKLDKDDGLMYTMEWGVVSPEEEALDSYYKVAIGGWYRTTNFVDYADRDRPSVGGGYLIGEKKIYSEEDSAQGLAIFGQLGFAQGDRSFIAGYYGAGLHYTGLFGCRDEDVTALGVAIAQHGTQYTDVYPESDRAETAIELTYRAPLGHGVTIQPDIQYIVNPGTDPSINDALVVGTRLEVVF